MVESVGWSVVSGDVVDCTTVMECQLSMNSHQHLVSVRTIEWLRRVNANWSDECVVCYGEGISGWLCQ